MMILIAVILGVVSIYLGRMRPRVAILLLLYMQIFFMRSTAEFTWGELVFITTFLGTSIGWIFKVKASGWKIPNSLLNLPMFLLLFSFTISIIPACFNDTDLVTWLANIAKYYNLWLFFLVMREYKDRDQILNLGFHFIIVAILMTLYDISRIPWAISAHELLAGVEFYSMYFLLAISIIFAAIAVEKNWKREIILFFLLFIFVARALSSGERSYWIVVAIISILMLTKIILIVSKQAKKILSVIGFLLILLIIIFSSLGKFNALILRTIERFKILLSEDIYSEMNISVLYRILEIKQVWLIAWERPLLGWGLAPFEMFDPITNQYYTRNFVHFIPLDIFLSFGLFGLVATVLWIILLFLQLHQSIKKERSIRWKLIIWALYANLISIVLLSFVSRMVISQSSLFYLALFTGIVDVIRRIQTKEKE